MSARSATKMHLWRTGAYAQTGRWRRARWSVESFGRKTRAVRDAHDSGRGGSGRFGHRARSQRKWKRCSVIVRRVPICRAAQFRGAYAYAERANHLTRGVPGGGSGTLRSRYDHTIAKSAGGAIGRDWVRYLRPERPRGARGMRAGSGRGISCVRLWKASVARLVVSETLTVVDEVAQADSAIERVLSANGSDAQSLRVEYQIAVLHDSEVRMRMQSARITKLAENRAVHRPGRSSACGRR